MQDDYVPVPLPVLQAKVLADQTRQEMHYPQDRTITCEHCEWNALCDYAFDPYNTDGDCLAMK